MKLGIAISGMASRLAAMRRERLRDRAIRAALESLAERARRRDGFSEAPLRAPDAPPSDDPTTRS